MLVPHHCVACFTKRAQGRKKDSCNFPSPSVFTKVSKKGCLTPVRHNLFFFLAQTSPKLELDMISGSYLVGREKGVQRGRICCYKD